MLKICVDPGGDKKTTRHLDTGLGSLPGNVSSPPHILVTGVGTTANQSVAQTERIALLFGFSSKLRKRPRQIWGEGADNVRLEGAQIDFDDSVEVLLRLRLHFVIGVQQVLVLTGSSGPVGAVGGSQIVTSSGAIREDRCGCTKLSTHVGNCCLTSSTKASRIAKILDNGRSATSRTKNTGDLEDDVFRLSSH